MPSAAAPPEQPLLPLLPRASLPCITHGRFYLKQTCLPLPPVCCCRLEALETTSRDCEQLMPQAQVALAGRAGGGGGGPAGGAGWLAGWLAGCCRGGVRCWAGRWMRQVDVESGCDGWAVLEAAL